MRKYWRWLMPLYEYKHCGKTFEVFKPMSERAAHPCPKCGKPAPLIFSVSHDHWGFTFTEASHHEGNDSEEITSRRPSNEGLVRQ